VEQGKGLGVLS